MPKRLESPAQERGAERAPLVSIAGDVLTIEYLNVQGPAAAFVQLSSEAGQDEEKTVRRMLEVGALVLQHGAQSALAETVVSAIQHELSHHRDVLGLREQTTAKGFDFERQVGAVLESFFGAFNDEIADTGMTPGADGRNKRGDFTIKLDPASIGGRHRRIVVEVKDKRQLLLTGKTGELVYLSEAMENRSADVGVLVCSGFPRGLAGIRLRLYPGNRVVVVFDKSDPDPLALEVACGLARALATGVQGGESGADHAYLLDRVASLRSVVEQAADISRGVSAARRGLNTVEDAYSALARDAWALLAELEDRLAEGVE